MNLTLVICENGLGHFKRLIGLANYIIDHLTSCNINIICQDWQIQRTKDWFKTNTLLQNPRVYFHTSILNNSVYWTNDPQEYSDGRLTNWIEKLKNQPVIQEADCLISDNLVELLSIREDTILCGSFLWFDILENAYPKIESVKRFIDFNKNILAKHTPSMICVKDVAMPAVITNTKAIKMPWFAQEKKYKNKEIKKTKRIVLLTGASTVSDFLTNTILDQIVSLSDIEIAIPGRVIQSKKITHSKVIPFNFSLNEFHQCDLVICRPGVGTITDALTTQTPMLTFYEKDNMEMEFNSSQLEKLGLAKNIGPIQSQLDLRDQILSVLQESNLTQFRSNMKNVQLNGFEKTFDWLIKEKFLYN